MLIRASVCVTHRVCEEMQVNRMQNLPLGVVLADRGLVCIWGVRGVPRSRGVRLGGQVLQVTSAGAPLS